MAIYTNELETKYRDEGTGQLVYTNAETEHHRITNVLLMSSPCRFNFRRS
jgi:hypothetical protein